MFRCGHGFYTRGSIPQLQTETFHTIELIQKNKQIFSTQLRLPKRSPKGGAQAIEGEVWVGTHAPRLPHACSPVQAIRENLARLGYG